MHPASSILSCLLLTIAASQAAEPRKTDDLWQYYLPYGQGLAAEDGAIQGAYLWIPKDCTRVRAVFQSSKWAFDSGLMQSSMFRAALARNGIAVVQLTMKIPGIYGADTASRTAHQQVLDRLAAVSGYPEIAHAPRILTAYSATHEYPSLVAGWDPQAVLGIASFEAFPVKLDSTRFRSIPMLFGFGVICEWFPYWGDPQGADGTTPKLLKALRGSPPDLTAGNLLAYSGTHLYFSERVIPPYIAFFDAICRLRLPERMDPDGSTTLRDLPLDKGWLADARVWETKGVHPIAPYGSYTGPKDQAFWYPDEATARLCNAYGRDEAGRAPQHLIFLDHGAEAPRRAMNKAKPADGVMNLYELAIDPGGDRMTFTVEAAHAQSNRPHGSEAITYRNLWGPVEQVDGATWRVKYNRNAVTPLKDNRFNFFSACLDGDATYRGCNAAAVLTIPAATSGTAQTLDFPAIPDVPRNRTRIDLNARASSGLPVDYFVVGGPVVLDGASLVISDIPAKAAFPIAVTVGAYQIGRRGAEPVKGTPVAYRSFYITRSPGDPIPAGTDERWGISRPVAK